MLRSIGQTHTYFLSSEAAFHFPHLMAFNMVPITIKPEQNVPELEQGGETGARGLGTPLCDLPESYSSEVPEETWPPKVSTL